MRTEEKLRIYDRNQQRLIKALIKKQRENKFLINLNTCYAMFLTQEQMEASEVMAEAMVKKEMMPNDAS